MSPFLNTGVMFAAFQLEPVWRLRLMMRVMEVKVDGMVSFRHFAVISLGPDDFLGSNFLTILDTSSSDTGSREKEKVVVSSFTGGLWG